MAEGGFLARRGMSPLIATVLLMAFAVALGGMIMNWGISVSVSGECQDLHEHVTVTQFCTEGNDILLRMRSGPDGPAIHGVQLRILAHNIENTVNVKNSALDPGGNLDLRIPFVVTGTAQVDLIGLVGPAAEPYVCANDPIERVDPIQEC